MNIFIESEKEYDNIFVYHHIPKCGGSTLAKVIDKNHEFDFTDSFVTYGTVEHKPKIRELLDNFNGHIRGHFFYEDYIRFLENNIEKNLEKCTMLRDPLDRVISTYYYNLENDYTRPGYTFKDFIRDENQNKSHNYMTRFLTSNKYYTTHLDKAIENLNSFEHVGVLERFDEFLEYLQFELGWDDISYEITNKTSSRPSIGDIDKEDIEIIKEANQKDYKLYEHAENLFEEKAGD